jgi:uncharacterized linocin/CFP29 family protein
MELAWDEGQMDMAQKFARERFAQNCVAGHLSPLATVDERETTVRRSRYDFSHGIVVDREVLILNEPFAFCKFTKAQVDEFSELEDEALEQTNVVTTITRAASSLARWHDVLFFKGPDAALAPANVQMPPVATPPQSLREAALEAEKLAGVASEKKPVPIIDPLNEGLVAAVYDAVLRLEGRGYFRNYHLVLGETLWRALHTPTSGSMVLPRDRIQPTLMGGDFYRTTVLPEKEALIVSRDGPTFDCVIAGDAARYPRFEFLRVEDGRNYEQLYLFRLRERFAPRVRENRSVVRLAAT